MVGDEVFRERVVAHIPLLLIPVCDFLCHCCAHRVKRGRRVKVCVAVVGTAFSGGDGVLLFFEGNAF